MTTLEHIYERAARPRPNKSDIDAETKEALASYFAGNQLYPFIYPFSRIENQEKLGWRRFQTVKHYRNFPKEIARQYVEGVYRTRQISRVYGDSDFDCYLGDQYDAWFRKEFAIQSLILPELYVIVSKPDFSVQLLTREDERELGIDPYPSVVYPHYVQNFELRRDGKLEWISFKRPTVNDDQGYILYTDKLYVELDVKGRALREVPHGWDTCPVVRIAWTENTAYEGNPPMGHAFLKEVIDLSLANLQYTSMLVEMGYFHLSYKIVMGEETAKRTIESGIGNQTAIVEEHDEKGTTRYLELPRMEISELKDLVFEKMPAAAFHAARLRDRSATVAQSGLAKAFDMVPETAALYSVADFWSTYDRQIIELLAQGYFGCEKAEEMETQAKVQYPISFDVRTPQETMSDFVSFANAMVTSKLPVSETAVREMVKRMQRVFLEDLDSDTLSQIDEETDEAPFESLT